MIEIIIRRDPATPEIEEIGCLVVDDAGNLLVVRTNDVHSLVRPSVRPLRPGEHLALRGALRGCGGTWRLK
jgi:hypothetical protein